MTTNLSDAGMMRDFARRYAANGYRPIPADAETKMPLRPWKHHCESYSFDEAWRNCADSPGIALILRGLVCTDFDKHGSEPNGMTYFRYLEAEYPSVFKGTIIEATQNDGRHVYYRWTIDLPLKQWLCPVKIGDTTINLEVKTGPHLAFCYPSIKGGKLAYNLLQGSFETVPLRQLSPLPTLYRYYKPAPVKPARTPVVRQDMTLEQRDAAVDIIVDIYRHNAGHDGRMHNGGLGMARYMAGLGYGAHEINRALKAYEAHGHRQFKRGELEGLVDDGLAHPDRDAKAPWKWLKEARYVRK